MSVFLETDTTLTSPLQWMLMERCLFAASQIVRRSYITMALEGQAEGLTVAAISQQIIALAEKFFDKPPRWLWDDDDGGDEWEQFKK